MKLITLLLMALLSFTVEAQVKADNITTNNPSKQYVDLLKGMDFQVVSGVYLPKGTTAQRPTPTKDGIIRFNSDTNKPEVYANGTWGSVGGGLSLWVTATPYAFGDVVIESNKIYRCLVAHTSGTFATDLANGDWVELSTSEDKITGPASATDNGIVRYDGTTGKLAQDSQAVVDDNGDIAVNNGTLNGIKLGQEISRQMATGVVDGALSIGTPNTTFSFSQLTLAFSDYSASAIDPVVKDVVCPAVSNIPIASPTDETTYVLIDDACVITQQSTFPTQIERRTKAFLGRLAHLGPTAVITTAATLPDFVVDTNSQLYDLFDAIGAFNISGNIISPNGANLSFNKSSGVTFRRSVGYATNKKNPNTISIAAQTPVSSIRLTQSTLDVGPYTVIDPANYDVGGVITAIPGANARSTNRRVYLFSNGLIAVQYGQQFYPNLAEAIAGISTETFVVHPQALDGGVLLGIISCRKDATLLNDPTNCVITKVGRFDQTGAGTGSLATTTMQQAYDNSVTPQITTSTVGGSLDIKRGSAADTDYVFTTQNGAGAATSSLQGDGTLKAANISGFDGNEFRNSSFESTNYSDWTITNGTASESTAALEATGKRSVSILLSGALSMTQNSTLMLAQQDQVQKTCAVLVSSTDVSDLQLCSTKNGVEDKCTTQGGYVQGSGTRPLTVSFLAGTVGSNGCKLKSTDTTGTVKVDRFVMYSGAPIVNFNGGEFVGSIRYTSAANCAWATTSTTWASFAADTDCSAPAVVGRATAPATKIPAIVIPDYKPGRYLIQVTAFGSMANATPAASGSLRIVDGTFAGSDMFASTTIGTVGMAMSTTYSTTIVNTATQTNATLQMQGYTTNASNSMGIYNASSNMFEIVVYYFPETSSSAYVASSADYPWTSCSPVIGGLGAGSTQDNVFKCRRIRGQLEMNGYIRKDLTNGSGTSSVTFTLPNSLVIDSSKISQSILGMTGTAVMPNKSASGTLIQPYPFSSTAIAIREHTGSTDITGADLVASDYIGLNISVPIVGWDDSGVVVATLEGHNWTTERFSGNGSQTAFTLAASPATIENTFVTINGVTQDTNTYSISGTTLTFTEAPPTGTNNIQVRQAKINAAAVPSDGSVTAAKVAQGSGINVTSGATAGKTVETFSFSFGATTTTPCTSGTCAYLDQIGSAVSSVQRVSLGTYLYSFSKTYSKLKCSGSFANPTNYPAMTPANCTSSCSSVQINVGSGASAVDSFGTVFCQGEY